MKQQRKKVKLKRKRQREKQKLHRWDEDFAQDGNTSQ